MSSLRWAQQTKTKQQKNSLVIVTVVVVVAVVVDAVAVVVVAVVDAAVLDNNPQTVSQKCIKEKNAVVGCCFSIWLLMIGEIPFLR